MSLGGDHKSQPKHLWISYLWHVSFRYFPLQKDQIKRCFSYTKISSWVEARESSNKIRHINTLSASICEIVFSNVSQFIEWDMLQIMKSIDNI